MRLAFQLLALLALLTDPANALAHRLDEYLQATLVDIDPGKLRLHVNLTPGEALAGSVLDLVDRNHDGVISTNESTAYAELVKRDLAARVDGRTVELHLASVSFPEPAEIRSGWGIIMVEYEVALGPLAAGSHTFTLHNRHLPSASVYLFNAAQPKSPSVRIGVQKRNDNQSEGEITFDFTPPATQSASVGMAAWLAALLAVATAVWKTRSKRNLDV